MRPLYVYLPDDIYEGLRTKSLKEKTTMKELVTEALAIYMHGQAQNRDEKGSENTGKTPMRERLLNLVVDKDKKGDMKFTL